MADLAEDCKERQGKPYQPANGSEGDIFMANYCRECTKDINQDCPIISLSMCLAVDDKNYPKEWIYGADGQPTCAAFTPTNSEEL